MISPGSPTPLDVERAERRSHNCGDYVPAEALQLFVSYRLWETRMGYDLLWMIEDGTVKNPFLCRRIVLGSLRFGRKRVLVVPGIHVPSPD
jgi:hypothetical protein